MSIRDRQPWQKLSRPANSSTATPPDRDARVARPSGFSRRRFIHTAVGTTALALGPRLSSSAIAQNHDSAAQHRHGRPTPAPQPIPGGSDLSGFGLTPPYDFIHVFAPGEEGLVLPYTGVVLQGLDVEPGTITDFDGFTAVAFHVGEARGSDGKLYNLETDFRFMDGTYVAVDGTTRRGSFALIWIDLFEPSLGSQVHDNNGGIPLSGLFWTVELPRGAFHVSTDGRRASVQVKDLVVLDTFQFAGPFLVPSTVSFRIEWEANGPAQPHGSGNSVPATDPAAFLGMIAPARSTGQFSGAELGFTFEGRGAANSEIGYAQLGTERNGVFL